MKICVLVKEVPDAAVDKRIDPETKRLDRSGEKNLNPFDTHALEAAMQVKEGGADVEECYKRAETLLSRYKKPDGSLGVVMSIARCRMPPSGPSVISVWRASRA